MIRFAILISSNLSGTYQCARLAAESCDFEDVFFVDSRTASQGEGILIREALRLRDEEHLPAHAIAAELEQRVKIVEMLNKDGLIAGLEERLDRLKKEDGAYEKQNAA